MSTLLLLLLVLLFAARAPAVYRARAELAADTGDSRAWPTLLAYTFHDHSRAPWYTIDGKPVSAYVIGIAGGSASGKVSSCWPGHRVEKGKSVEPRQTLRWRIACAPLPPFTADSSRLVGHSRWRPSCASSLIPLIGRACLTALYRCSVTHSEILKALDAPSVLVISQDSFYKSLTSDQSKSAFRNEYDFDCPAAFDWETLRDCISDLKQCRSVEIPVYSFVLHQRTEDTQYLYGASVIILEGLFVLSDPELRDLMDMKIFGT